MFIIIMDFYDQTINDGLIDSSKKWTINEVIRCFNGGANIECKDYQGETPLTLNTKEGHK